MTRQERIRAYLIQTLAPLFLEVQNESNRHQVPIHSETHFKVTVVSDKFQQLTRIERHRLVNDLLASELKSGLHALSLHLYTPENWEQKNGAVPASPACRHGEK